MPERESFYVTTPIFYVNDVPHIGHAYTEVIADILARWHRQRGDDTFFLTGTDEHGQKILRTATANGVSPQEWTDKLVKEAWFPMLAQLGISNDDFIRTTEERHETQVQRFFQHLYDTGYIYDHEYEALYCVGCEEFKPASEIVDGTGEFEGQKVCAIHSKPLELMRERNWFFAMSKFQDALLDLYRERPDFVQPASARNEVISFVRQGLTDLSISRASFDWGVKVPWDDSQVIYVWVDALLNYITAAGWGQDDEAFCRRWPANHIVGKDILRFHAVIWPAMLMAAGIEVPDHVFGHGWLLVGGEKMSKSKLTGIEPSEITDVFGVDAFRYYFARAISFGQDGSFSWEDIAARYQAELANGYGNLASRSIAMIHKYFDGRVPERHELTDADRRIDEAVTTATRTANDAIDSFAPHEALGAIWKLVDELNGYITEQEPWKIAKDPANTERLETVLGTIYHGVVAMAVLSNPIIPGAAATLWSALGCEGSIASADISSADTHPGGSAVGELRALFPRVEAAKA